jgi:hypothetical protein
MEAFLVGVVINVYTKGTQDAGGGGPGRIPGLGTATVFPQAGPKIAGASMLAPTRIPPNARGGRPLFFHRKLIHPQEGHMTQKVTFGTGKYLGMPVTI